MLLQAEAEGERAGEALLLPLPLPCSGVALGEPVVEGQGLTERDTLALPLALPEAVPTALLGVSTAAVEGREEGVAAPVARGLSCRVCVALGVRHWVGVGVGVWEGVAVTECVGEEEEEMEGGVEGVGPGGTPLPLPLPLPLLLAKTAERGAPTTSCPVAEDSATAVPKASASSTVLWAAAAGAPGTASVPVAGERSTRLRAVTWEGCQRALREVRGAAALLTVTALGRGCPPPPPLLLLERAWRHRNTASSPGQPRAMSTLLLPVLLLLRRAPTASVPASPHLSPAATALTLSKAAVVAEEDTRPPAEAAGRSGVRMLCSPHCPQVRAAAAAPLLPLLLLLE